MKINKTFLFLVASVACIPCLTIGIQAAALNIEGFKTLKKEWVVYL